MTSKKTFPLALLLFSRKIVLENFQLETKKVSLPVLYFFLLLNAAEVHFDVEELEKSLNFQVIKFLMKTESFVSHRHG